MSDGEPLFLKIGLTLANLNSVGYIPRESDLLNNCDSGLAMRSAVSFRNCAGRPSGPVDLFASSEFSIARTSCSLIVMWWSFGVFVFVFLCGGMCESGMSKVYCLAKWSLKSVAFSLSSVSTSSSLVSNGGMFLLVGRPIIVRNVLWYL